MALLSQSPSPPLSSQLSRPRATLLALFPEWQGGQSSTTAGEEDGKAGLVEEWELE